MKKQLLFVSTVILSLAFISCEDNSNMNEIKDDVSDVDHQLQEDTKEARDQTNKTFEELKREAEEKNRKAKERIKYEEEEAANTFKKLKDEANEATRDAEVN